MALIVLSCLLFFAVSYIGIIFILFKGKQHNRFFATFLSTCFPVFGSIPSYVMACKYEKRISTKTKKINNRILKYILASLQLISVLVLLAPFFEVGREKVDFMNIIFSSNVQAGVIKPAFFLVYVVILSGLSILLNVLLTKTNISNFFTYLVSFINMFSVLAYCFIIKTFSEEVATTSMMWVYTILNIVIMAMSMFSLIVTRDLFLFKLEYSEKIEYIKEQKQKAEKLSEDVPPETVYKCSKCGRMVKKGTYCTCIPKKSELIKVPVSSDKSQSEEAKEDEKNENFLPASFCIYCKKPLSVGEVCKCQGEGFGITVKNEPNTNRKCMYCGQVLVGETPCVCEKIMKNSAPVSEDKEPKKYFESQIEKGTSFVANELEELEKMINSKFDVVKENIESSGNCTEDDSVKDESDDKQE